MTWGTESAARDDCDPAVVQQVLRERVVVLGADQLECGFDVGKCVERTGTREARHAGELVESFASMIAVWQKTAKTTFAMVAQ